MFYITMKTITEPNTDIDYGNRISLVYMDFKMPKGGNIYIMIKTFVCFSTFILYELHVYMDYKMPKGGKLHYKD